MVLLHRASKRRPLKPWGLVVAVFILCIFPALSLSAGFSDGTQAAPFLYIPAGPRLMIFPSVISSAYPDASLIFSNPAPLAFIEGEQFFVTSSNWLDDVSYSAAGFVWPVMSSEFKAGIGARFVYSGQLKGYSDGMRVISEESYYDAAFTASLSRKLPFLDLAAAASVTYIRENLGDISGNGLGFSAGLFKNLGRNSFTIFFENAGGKLSFSDASFDLDASLALGFARGIKKGWGFLEMGGELKMFRSGDRELRFGADYLINRFLALRVGTLHSLSSVENSRYPLSAGLSFRLRRMSIDYAFTPRDYFSNTHAFSFSFAFRRDNNPSIVDPVNASSRDGTYPRGSKTSSSSLEYSSKLIRKGLKEKAVSLRDGVNRQESIESNKKRLFIVAGGEHKVRLGAESEVHALRLLDVPAVIKKMGDVFVVTIGSFYAKAAAKKLVDSYRRKGYSFHILEVEN